MGWIENVKAARAEKSLSKAIAILSHELSLRPSDPQVHYQLAWTHDALGKECDAVPAYEKAIELGLSGEDLKSAFLGLGSTYRTLGEYEKSMAVFERGLKIFPDDRPLKVFSALTQYNLGRHNLSMEILIIQLAETTADDSIKEYKRPLLFYADKLDQVFE